MDTPRPSSGADDPTLAAPNFANITPTDWDALMSRRANPDSPFWERVFSDWDAKWKSVPKEDAPQQERDLNAPEPAPHTSSSSSLSLPEEDQDAIPQQKSRKKKPKYFRESLAKTVNGAIQRTRVKRRAKKWFTQLTANLNKNTEEPRLSQAWRQRRVAGEELLRIAEQEADGDVAVARRFTKSPTRLVIGLRSILWLCEEEEEQETMHYSNFYSMNRNPDLRYSASRRSYCLMILVMLHADRSLFLETTVPGALREGIDDGLRVIHFLATSIPDFFDCVDPAAIHEYAIKAINSSTCPRYRKTQASQLIYHAFCGGLTSTEQGKEATLSTSRLILNSTVIVQMGWVAKAKGIFPSIFTPAVLSNIIRTLPSASESNRFTVPDDLVLKLLALWTDELQIGTIMSPEQVAWLAEVCMKAMRNERFSKKEWVRA
ncbi:hypothetical protein FS837_010375 [Tulasnella sp. UAMH 9824]|nr:hypothetical protein FS837_010375 [Tulasnella sp. UAMH 9824]